MAENRERQQKASEELDELESVVREIAGLLRTGVPDRLAYALAYRLRREVGYVVRDLGAGIPAAPFDQQAAEIIENQRSMVQFQKERKRRDG